MRQKGVMIYGSLESLRRVPRRSCIVCKRFYCVFVVLWGRRSSRRTEPEAEPGARSWQLWAGVGGEKLDVSVQYPVYSYAQHRLNGRCKAPINFWPVDVNSTAAYNQSLVCQKGFLHTKVTVAAWEGTA